jgi:hypothetical protein
MNSKKKIMIGGGPKSAFDPVKPQRFDNLDEMFASEDATQQEKYTIKNRNERKFAFKQIKDLFKRKVLPSCCNKF